MFLFSRAIKTTTSLTAATVRQVVLCGVTLCLTLGALSASALSLTSVVSRKTHGSAGTFDLPIDTTQPITGLVTVEPRTIGLGHTIVFHFDGPLTSTGSLSVVDNLAAPVAGATAALSPSGTDVVVTLQTIADNKRVTISLNNVSGMGLNVSASLGFRVGDTSSSGTVTAADVNLVKSHAGQTANSGNFQFDLNASGVISASDIIDAKKALARASVTRAATTVALTSSVNPSSQGQSVTFTATVSVTPPGTGTPTGTVSFKDGGVDIGACSAQPLMANVATCVVSTLSVASHTITAVYGGDTNFNASPASPAVIQAVNTCASGPVAAAPRYASPAGVNAVVYNGDAVTLQIPSITPGSCGSATSNTYTYNWSLASKPVGSTATLSSSTAASPSFVADVAGGTYQLSVNVTDGLGNASTTQFLSVTVSPCGAQAPSVTVDRPNVSQANFAPVTITATATSPDNQNSNPALPNYCPARFAKTLNYQWQVTSSPGGGNYTLNGATTAVATLTPSARGAYAMRLVVTDSAGIAAAQIIVAINVTCGDQPPAVTTVGAVPAWSATQSMASITQKTGGGTSTGPLTITSTSLASPPIPFYSGTPVHLSANVTDANYTCGFTPTTTTYRWAFTSVPPGSQVSFDSATSATPAFTPDVPGDYYVQLTLTDAAGQTSTQTFTPRNGGPSIKVSNCGKGTPVSQIGFLSPVSPAPTTTTIGATNGYGVVLDGTSSFTPDNAPVDFTQATVTGCGLSKPISYSWSFLSTPPAAAGISFNEPTGAKPAFYPTVSGTYVVGLQINDGSTNSTVSTATVVTVDQASSGLDYVASPGNNLLIGGTHHFNSFRVPVGATVLLDPASATQYLDIRVTGDVFVGGSINVSGSAGGDGPTGDVSWQGTGGGQTGYPFAQGATPNPAGGCSTNYGGSNVAVYPGQGGQGNPGADGAVVNGACGAGRGGNNGGGSGGGSSGGGGGGYGGGGGGGGNTCAGNAAGGNGGGPYAGAGGGVAQGGGGGSGGGAPYDGTAGTSVILGQCVTAGGGFGAGGGGGSIGVTAAQDPSMASTFQTGSAGGGGAGDSGRGGGGGGGAIRIIGGGAIVVSGSILANGGRGGDSGGDPFCCQGGSGGGGSGGAIWLSAPTLYLSGALSAAGGRGGISQSSRGAASGNGGAGGLGRIRLASPLLSNYGIATPALPSRFDGTANGNGLTWVTNTADSINLP